MTEFSASGRSDNETSSAPPDTDFAVVAILEETFEAVTRIFRLSE
jgi:hypothetical protein